MITLNLINKKKSGIIYEITNFSDTQKALTIKSFSTNNSPDTIWQNTDLSKIKDKKVTIISRMTWEDVQLIILATTALKELKVKEINLFVPYFLGARSDRKFNDGSSNYLKTVICPIINSLQFNEVQVIDAHSYVLEGCLNNYKGISNLSFVRECFRSLYGLSESRKNNNFILLSPDAGASHKIFQIAKDLDATNRVLECSKERDKNGKIVNVHVPINKSAEAIDYIIIDDICDGGSTFINIAKKIKEIQETQSYKSKIYLICTHGIFSKGFSELSKYVDKIFTTNSCGTLHSNIQSGKNTLIDSWIGQTEEHYFEEIPKDLITQIDITKCYYKY